MNQPFMPRPSPVGRPLQVCSLNGVIAESPMCIGVLCHGAGSGSTRVAIDLALALHRRGHPTYLLTLGHPRWQVPADLNLVCISIEDAPQSLEAEWNDRHVDQLAAALGEACRGARLDVLNYHYGFPFAQACHRMARSGMRDAPALVATLHGGDILRAERDAIARRRLLEALNGADAVCTVSHAYGARVEALIGRKTPCHVIPNFVPAARIVAHDPLRKRNTPPTLAHISNFKPVKNVQQTGQAFLAIRRQQRCALLLAGDGPQRRSLQDMLRPWDSSVRFLGRQESSRSAIAAADVLLVTSAAESFSLVALEAMTAGVPVVAPRVEGLSETVIDGESGLLFTPGRPADAALKIMRLLNCPELYRRISRSAQRQSRQYSETRTVDGYLNMFAGLGAR